MYALSSGATLGIVVALAVLAAGVLFAVMARGRDVRGAGALSRETVSRDKSAVKADTTAVVATSAREVEMAAAASRSGAVVLAASLPPAPWSPPDPEAHGATRRHFLNLSMITLMGTALSGFGAACIAFLWPRAVGGFGSEVNVGKLSDVIAGIGNSQGFYYVPEARTWITKYPADAIPKAQVAYGKTPSLLPGMQAGIVALYQKCPHLGCRVPECKSSQWFECPCHGSQYNRVGEKKAGPAPRGMDRFNVTIKNGDVVVDTRTVVAGPALGTNTTGQEAEGPHCVGGGAGGH